MSIIYEMRSVEICTCNWDDINIELTKNLADNIFALLGFSDGTFAPPTANC